GGLALAAKPLVCGSDSTLAVAPFEPAHHEVCTRHLLEVVDEGVVHRCTTERADDRHRLCCELLRHHHAKAGCDLCNEPDHAPPASTPRSAMKRAASATDLARSPRAAKYPLSAAFASPSRVPRANTCRQARALSGSERSSPSLRATSPIDRSMMMVEIGSSTG